ncbi:Acyl-CoA dehydrogenase related to the alkylation response protein AidB [Pseudomonas syringae pv. actinidiae]|uniref:Acyl-CoA dehydrogenase related to the alkylation response protein AidB n=1 Tax=Pseudomonas syringae pv. actinidiae TaxID=103796 RepID=A0AAN4Q7U5_PSESF|nr:Acyl-CoA dehydrogenase related to the alkylation response protein AidB [Pseudomonas syringae pv. actinidiae]
MSFYTLWARCSLLGVLAEFPPDQRQGSAVTYVALCVVSATVIKKRFDYQLSCGADL